MRGLWIMAVAACAGSSDVQPDAVLDSPVDTIAPPLRYSLDVSWWSRPMWPDVQTKPEIYIDGVPTKSLVVEYASAAVATGLRHRVELRHGTLVVASATVQLGGPGSCLDMVRDATDLRESLCAFATGELRYAGEGVSGPTSSCSGDGFCSAPCDPHLGWGCAPGARCTSIYASLDPLATHLGCAPAGPRAAGESCTLVMTHAGIHDDCGSQLLCVEGTCRPLCGTTASCTSCSYPSGHAPELSFCE